MRCLAQRIIGASATDDGPAGYWPSDLQYAYALPSSTNGAGMTVAIVDANDAPNIEQDMATYRQTFGLPACTSASGCFTKVNQNGQAAPLPDYDPGWTQEISLDVDMVSAACPLCKIVLVEADVPDNQHFDVAEQTAARFAPVAISNSYGAPEYSFETTDDPNYVHPGIAVVASTGDDGYGVVYPAASPNVIAVGGTKLLPADNSRGASETVWFDSDGKHGTGSGCSQYEPKPAWQRDAGCHNRTVGDVSAVADPGIAVYADGQWLTLGGTSAAAPIVAATYALAGRAPSSINPVRYLYESPQALNDVTSGNTGSCSPAYLCTAGAGYDGPTGNGTPRGISAFSGAGSFTPVTPHRILDTRTGTGAVSGPVRGDSTIRVKATGQNGVPASGVAAVVLNVTVTQPTAAGYVTAYPDGQPRPTASNLNFVAGQTVPNAVVAAVSPGGYVDLYDYQPPGGSAHLIADISGYYLAPGPPAAGTFRPVNPGRILDTRSGQGGRGPVGTNTTIRVKGIGQYGLPDHGVAAVVLNVTVTQPTASGYLTAFPDGQGRPTASNLNFVAGQTVPNLVVVPVSADGYFDLYDFQVGSGSAQVVADVSGYFLAGQASVSGSYAPVSPSRLLDTRIGLGAPQQPVGPDGVLRLRATGQYGVPASGVSAVVLNVTVTEPTAAGYVTAYPDNQPRPLASNLNFVAGQTVPNTVIVPVSPGGYVDLYNYAGSTQLVADISGYVLS